MSKKGWKAGAVLAAGAGITAVLAAKKRGNMEMDKMKKTSHGSRSDYRNTELGKHDKNSKGIYYTNGNYEAFARPEKPAGIEEKSAYLVGSGLASLAAACFLVRDAQMPGKNIHILEAMDIAGGACDGIDDPTRGYVMPAAAKWRIISSASGICSTASRPWRFQARPFSMSITG